MAKTETLTTRQAAELVGKSQSYIKLLCQYGQLKCRKLGRDWYISLESLLDYFPEVPEPKQEDKR